MTVLFIILGFIGWFILGILIGSLLTIWFFGIGRDSQEKEDE